MPEALTLRWGGQGGRLPTWLSFCNRKLNLYFCSFTLRAFCLVPNDSCDGTVRLRDHADLQPSLPLGRGGLCRSDTTSHPPPTPPLRARVLGRHRRPEAPAASSRSPPSNIVPIKM